MKTTAYSTIQHTMRYSIMNFLIVLVFYMVLCDMNFVKNNTVLDRSVPVIVLIFLSS